MSSASVWERLDSLREQIAIIDNYLTLNPNDKEVLDTKSHLYIDILILEESGELEPRVPKPIVVRPVPVLDVQPQEEVHAIQPVYQPFAHFTSADEKTCGCSLCDTRRRRQIKMVDSVLAESEFDNVAKSLIARYVYDTRD